MPNASKQSALEAAVADIDACFKRPAPPAPGTPGAKAYAAHLAREAGLEAIRRQHAEALPKAVGYSPALGAIVSPTDTVNFLADQLEASGVPVVRGAWGFRTMTPEEKASAAQKVAA